MDPKMDAGMATTGFKTFEEAIESGAAPIQLSVQQMVDIFDYMLACEVCLVFARNTINVIRLIFSFVEYLKLSIVICELGLMLVFV